MFHHFQCLLASMKIKAAYKIQKIKGTFIFKVCEQMYYTWISNDLKCNLSHDWKSQPAGQETHLCFT